MPPGPRGLPFLGNKHQVPAVKPWRTFAKWNQEYGEHRARAQRSTCIARVELPLSADLEPLRRVSTRACRIFLSGGHTCDR